MSATLMLYLWGQMTYTLGLETIHGSFFEKCFDDWQNGLLRLGDLLFSGRCCGAIEVPSPEFRVGPTHRFREAANEAVGDHFVED